MPFTWDGLTEDQRKVVRDIHDWLIAYVDRDPGSEHGADEGLLGWSLDSERPSNVLLIDGGRGSGKTSVLLSLINLWKRRLGPDPDAVRKDWEPLQPLLKQLSGRLIPVLPLDLQPLPASTSLRTWIAGRLLNLAESVASRGAPAHKGKAPGGQPVWKPGYEEEPAWRKAWRELLQDAAAGWHPAGGPDRSKLDPESLAVELEQAEFARLSIGDRWRTFVNEVAGHVSRSGAPIHADARIVIPIDDADMNPTRCVELLDLLRTLWHSRVVFLLTGHSDLFLKTLTLHLHGGFRAQLGGQAGSEEERALIEEREPTPGELAFQSYDKVLPPHQRFTLNTLALQERRRLLDEVLDIQLHRPDVHLRPGNLREYFGLNDYVLPSLPERLRKIQNLRQVWAQQEAHERRAATIVHALWREALGEERYKLSAEDARSIEAMVAVEDGRVRIRGMGWRFQRRVSQTKHFQFQGELCLLRLTEAVGFSYPLRTDERTTHHLPVRLNAALLLAVDLSLEESDESFDLLAPMPPGFDNPLVRNELTYLGSRLPVGSSFPTEAPAATWPLPNWRTSVDFAIFDRCWNHALRTGSGSSEARIGSIAAAFLRAVLAAYRRAPVVPFNQVEEAPDWATIARELVQTTHQLSQQRTRSDREEAFLQWLLGRAILLAAPESGLPADTANRLLSLWLEQLDNEDKALRSRALEAARTERAAQAARLNRGVEPASDFLMRLDAKFPQHEWARKVEMQGSAGAKSLQKLVGNELSNISTFLVDSNLSKPRNLKEYMDALRLHIPVTPYFAEQARKELENLRSTDRSIIQVIRWLWSGLIGEFGGRMPGQRRLIALSDDGAHYIFSPPIPIDERLELYTHRKVKDARSARIDNHDTRLRLYTLEPIALPEKLSQFLMLTHDVMVDMDEIRLSWNNEPEISTARFAPLPEAGTAMQFQGREVRLSWPVPRWPTFLDWILTEQKMAESLKPAMPMLDKVVEDRGEARRWLAACVTATLYVIEGIGRKREANFSLNVDSQSFGYWRSTGTSLRHILYPHAPNERPAKGHRAELVRAWAKWAVPLYATPEMGLPPEFARGLLAGWLGASFSLGEQDPLPPLEEGFHQGYRLLRRRWAARCLQQSGLSGTDEEARQFLSEIDRRNPDHSWHEVIGIDADAGSDEG